MKKIFSGNTTFFKVLLPAVYITLTLFSISIYAQSGAFSSKFLNQSVPDRMSPGQSYNLVVTFENNGNTSWTPERCRLKIISKNENNVTSPVWSINEMNFSNTVEPGKTATFEIKVTAPKEEGVYPFSAVLLNGSSEFGERSKQIDISVSSQVNLTEALNSAAFVEQTVQDKMEAGRSYKVMISFTNTGKTTWTSDNYRLVMLDASGNPYTGSSWNTYSVSLPENILPGSTKVFNFEIIPLVAGTYTMQWRMTSSQTGLFGDVSNPAVITVVNPPEIKNEGKSGKE